MSGLKLTVTTSIYGNPYELVGTLAATTSSTTTTCSYNLNYTTNTERVSVSWMITPCAPLPHVKINPRRNLGVRSHKSFSSSPPKSCSENTGGERESSSTLSGGIVPEKMGTEDKDDHYYKRQQPLLPPQQQSQLQQQFQHQQSSILFTLPTILTLDRVAAVPLFVSTLYVNRWRGTTATTCIIIAAAITDWLDGYIAWKMRLGTTFGAFLDPVADKLMVAATLILLYSRPMNVDMFGEVPWLFTVPSIAIIGREITTSAVREWASSQNAKLLETCRSGVLVASGVSLLYILAGLAVWSLVVYMRKIWKVLLK